MWKNRYFNLSTKALGDAGERLSVSYLRAHRYKIIHKNYSCPAGEIDLVCKRRGRLIFIEVKTRRTYAYGAPQEAVHSKKQQRIRKAAQWFMKSNSKFDTIQSLRFDVIALDLSGQYPILEHVRYAF